MADVATTSSTKGFQANKRSAKAHFVLPGANRSITRPHQAVTSKVRGSQLTPQQQEGPSSPPQQAYLHPEPTRYSPPKHRAHL